MAAYTRAGALRSHSRSIPASDSSRCWLHAMKIETRWNARRAPPQLERDLKGNAGRKLQLAHRRTSQDVKYPACSRGNAAINTAVRVGQVDVIEDVLSLCLQL